MRWTFLERIQVACSASPFRFVGIIAGTALLLTMVLSLWANELYDLLSAQSDFSNVTDWRVIGVAGQLTILGIVFPLVLAFIAILFGQQPRSKTLWELYQRYTAYFFVGTSGVVLAVSYALFEFATPWLTLNQQVAVCLSLNCWFIFNLVCTIVFLRATFTFVSEQKQVELINRFTVNNALIPDISVRLREKFFWLSFDKSFMGKLIDDDSVEIRPLSMIRQEKYSVQQSFRNPVFFSDIYYGVLRKAIWAWNPNVKPQAPPNKPMLVIQPPDGWRAYSKWTLAYSDVPFSKFAELLFRAAFKFSRKSKITQNSLNFYLWILVGAAQDALCQEDPQQFKLALDRFNEWNRILLGISEYDDDELGKGNLLMLEDSGYFGKTHLDDAIQQYLQLTSKAIAFLEKSPDFWYQASRVFTSVYLYSRQSNDNKVTKKLIWRHARIWKQLLEWDSAHEDVSGSRYFEALQSKAFRRFVESWEIWHSYLPDIERASDDDAFNCANVYGEHLQALATMVIAAVKNQDVYATEWSIDMLNTWLKHSFHENYHNIYHWRSKLLLPTLLEEEKNVSCWLHIINGSEFHTSAALGNAVANLWLDIRLRTAAQLLRRDPELENKSTLMAVKAVVDRTCFHRTGGIDGVHSDTRIASGQDVFLSYIRHALVPDDTGRKYSNMLEHAHQLMEGVDEEDRITGRIYSSMGDAQTNLRPFFTALWIWKSEKVWPPDWQIQDTLQARFFAASDTDFLHDEILRWAEPPEESIGIAKALAGDSFKEEYVSNAAESLKRLAALMEEQRNELIANASISEAKVAAFGKAVSDALFVDTPSFFPLPLFTDVHLLDGIPEGAEKSMARAGGFPAKRLMDDVETPGPINENRFFVEMCEAAILWDLVRPSGLIAQENVIEFSDEKVLLDAIVKKGRELQALEEPLHPVLWVSSYRLHALINRNLHPWGEEPDDLVVPFTFEKREGCGADYLCHIADIPVYYPRRRVEDLNVLTTLEAFQEVKFFRADSGSFITLDYERDDDDKTTGVLNMTIRFDAAGDASTSFGFRLNPLDDL